MIGLDSEYLAQRNETFDPFDNDYIEFRSLQWSKKYNDEMNSSYLMFEESENHQLGYCSE